MLQLTYLHGLSSPFLIGTSEMNPACLTRVLGLSIAEWGSIATVGTLIVAILLLIRESQDKRRRQAQLISAWAVGVSPQRSSDEFGRPISHVEKANSVLVHVRNGSEGPVYKFQAWVLNSFAPDAARIGSAERLLPPGETELWVDSVELPDGGLAEFPRVEVTFRDERGKRWQRTYDGAFGPDAISREGRRSKRFGGLRRLMFRR